MSYNEFDFIPLLFNDYKYHYSHLCQESKNIIDFNILSNMSIFSQCKVGSQWLQFFNVGVPFSYSVGFLTSNELPSLLSIESKKDASSISSNVETNGLAVEGLCIEKKEYSVYEKDKLVWIEERPKATSPSHHYLDAIDDKNELVGLFSKLRQSIVKPPLYIFYGKLNNQSKVDMALNYKVLPYLTLGLSGTSFLTNARSSNNMHLILQYNSTRADKSGFYNELIYEDGRDERHGRSNWIGNRAIYHFSPLLQYSELRISVGSELYYTAKEQSGGLSFGLNLGRRSKNHQSLATTMICNPIMGHLTTLCTIPLSTRLKMATRYDFNMYSFESDLAVGLDYLSETEVNEWGQNKEGMIASRLKCRWGCNQGLGLIYELMFGNSLRATFGANHDVSRGSSSTGFSLEFLS